MGDRVGAFPLLTESTVPRQRLFFLGLKTEFLSRTAVLKWRIFLFLR
jgi:hypothetical protein